MLSTNKNLFISTVPTQQSQIRRIFNAWKWQKISLFFSVAKKNTEKLIIGKGIKLQPGTKKPAQGHGAAAPQKKRKWKMEKRKKNLWFSVAPMVKLCGITALSTILVLCNIRIFMYFIAAHTKEGTNSEKIENFHQLFPAILCGFSSIYLHNFTDYPQMNRL